MKKIIVCAVLSVSGLWLSEALADSYWQGSAGGDLTDGSNWDAVPTADVRAYVKKAQSAPFTVSADPTFFGGAMLRYSGAFTYTNDFGAGVTLDVGATSATGFHVEDGAHLVHASGVVNATCSNATSTVLYITENSTLTLTGKDSTFKSTGSVNLRTNAQSGAPRYPRLEVQDGATFSIDKNLLIGAQTPCAFGCARIAGAGSKLTADIVDVGDTLNTNGTQTTSVCETNRLEVCDGGELQINILRAGDQRDLCETTVSNGGRVKVSKTYVGYTTMASNCTLTVAAGGILTNDNGLTVGCFTDGWFAPNDRLIVTGEGSLAYAGSTVNVQPGGSVLAEDGGVFSVSTLDRITCVSDDVSGVRGRLKVGTGGTLLVRGCSDDYNFVRLSQLAPFDLAEGTVRTPNDMAFDQDGQVPAVGELRTDAALRVRAAGVVVSNATVRYSKLYLDASCADIEFNGCDLEGGRFEMTSSNVVLRLVNTSFKVKAMAGSDYFMLGDGTAAALNAGYERYIYFGGTNTHVTVDESSNGLYFRSTNVTFNFDIPAEGFSTAHPVFEWAKSTGSPQVKVNVTVDPQLCYNGGGEYVLLKGPNATSDTQFSFSYDEKYVRLIKDATKNEVRVKAKNLAGLMIFIR